MIGTFNVINDARGASNPKPNAVAIFATIEDNGIVKE